MATSSVIYFDCPKITTTETEQKTQNIKNKIPDSEKLKILVYEVCSSYNVTCSLEPEKYEIEQTSLQRN